MTSGTSVGWEGWKENVSIATHSHSNLTSLNTCIPESLRSLVLPALKVIMESPRLVLLISWDPNLCVLLSSLSLFVCPSPVPVLGPGRSAPGAARGAGGRPAASRMRPSSAFQPVQLPAGGSEHQRSVAYPRSREGSEGEICWVGPPSLEPRCVAVLLLPCPASVQSSMVRARGGGPVPSDLYSLRALYEHQAVEHSRSPPGWLPGAGEVGTERAGRS